MIKVSVLPENKYVVFELSYTRSPLLPQVGYIMPRLHGLVIETASEEELNWGETGESVIITIEKVDSIARANLGDNPFSINDTTHHFFDGQFVLCNDDPSHPYVELTLVSMELDEEENARIDVNSGAKFILVRIGANEKRDKIDIEFAEVCY